MGTVRLLDCTLRDGGCLNDFCFGQETMEAIKRGLEEVGVDAIELGYLNSEVGTPGGRTQFDRLESANAFLGKRTDNGCLYTVMIDLGTFDPEDLPKRETHDIDGIRLAFHKRDLDKVKAVGQTVLAKGYRLFLQPMLTVSYTPEELELLLASVNEGLTEVEALYIVDSFGQMEPSDVRRLIGTFDKGLKPGAGMGFHAHDNLGLAAENTRCALDAALRSERDWYLDGSLRGMGKGAGNAVLEDLLVALEETSRHEGPRASPGPRYDIACARTISRNLIEDLHTRWPWGPCEEYRICSRLGCTPSYVGFLRAKNEGALSLDKLEAFLRRLPPGERIAFNRKLAEDLYDRQEGTTSLAFNESARH